MDVAARRHGLTTARWFALLFAFAPGCARSSAPTAVEAGAAPPGPPPRFIDGGPPPDAQVTCGGTACPEPHASDVLGEIACCLSSGGCGIRVPLLGDRCLSPAQAGTVEPECPPFIAPNGAVAQGCCSPAGLCGAYDRFGDLGCIVANPSDAGMHCTPHPDDTCRSVVAVPCDGPEDCETGSICCARSNFGLYDLYGCFRSCAAAEAADRGVWLAVCHSLDDCRDENSRCEAEEGLASGLSICLPNGSAPAPPAGRRDGGPTDASLSEAAVPREDASLPMTDEDGVVCGVARCPKGRTCCVREPGSSYCAANADGCSCSGPLEASADARGRDARDD